MAFKHGRSVWVCRVRLAGRPSDPPNRKGPSHSDTYRSLIHRYSRAPSRCDARLRRSDLLAVRVDCRCSQKPQTELRTYTGLSTENSHNTAGLGDYTSDNNQTCAWITNTGSGICSQGSGSQSCFERISTIHSLNRYTETRDPSSHLEERYPLRSRSVNSSLSVCIHTPQGSDNI